jgi:ribonuclease R
MSMKKNASRRGADPHLERERGRYEFPLPSREFIRATLEEQGRPVGFDELCELLDIRDDEETMFQRRLAAMAREAELMQNRKGAYIVPEKAQLIAGRVQGHPDGYGFLIPDAGGEDVFLGARQMEKVLHGDRVLGRIVGVDRRGRPEGVVVEVTERGTSRVVGRLVIEHGVVFVAPENRRISQDILIPPDAADLRKLSAGQVVVAEITEPPTRYSKPIGRIVEILGNYADPGMEIEIALRKHDMPYEFSREVEKETKAIPDKVKKGDLAGREDLRELPLVTIDGETAKDFDDAVFCEKRGRGWRLVVAIADVSHYVRPGMALDAEARERGNSVYFPRRVIPMLPEKLSNGLCSLNPEVERLAMVCDMDIAASGAIKGYRFYPAVFRSRARLTYTQVWNWLSGSVKPETAEQRALLSHLEHLYALFHALSKARDVRGAIDFETVETMMVFDEQGKIANIVPVVRNDAHRIIEECMLAANVCASEFLKAHQQTCLYRIHEGPTPEKLKALRDFLKEFGFSLGGGEEPHAKDYAKLLGQIQGRPDTQLLQTVMLRSLRQAMYSPDNVGHFGLSYESYTHFTSPIRRYPDLLVHRAIKAVLAGETYAPGDWAEIGLHCSATERRADEATRDVVNWLKCYYMRDRIGEEFAGTIASVVPFGVFIALDEVFVEGLIHVSELGEDYFQYDQTRHQMLGERSGKRFRLGDRLRVRLVRADLETGKIDFALVDAPAGKQAAASATAVSSAGGKPPRPTTPLYAFDPKQQQAEAAQRQSRKKGGAASEGDGKRKAAAKKSAKSATKPAIKSTKPAIQPASGRKRGGKTRD